MRRSAILFDLDGTLVDSLPDLAAAVNRLLAENGHPLLGMARIAAMVGDGAALLVERALTASGHRDIAGQAALGRFLALYEADSVRHTRPYPGVPAVLDELARQGCRFAICTNKPERATRTVLAGLGLDRFFGLVLGGDSLPQRKPDPAPLHFALDQLGAAAGAAVMVGDHRNDILAAQAAGVAVIFARYGYGLPSLGPLEPDATIDRFWDLPAALRALA